MGTVASPPDRFESLREQLVDYLYNQADAATTRSIESAMAESEAFSLEVDALARTLRISRRALAVASSSAPSRVRSSVLAAASEQAARMRESGLEPTRVVVRNATDDHGRSQGVLATLWRWFSRPYTFSLVGAAAVFAIFIMTRGQNAPELADEAMRRVAESSSEPAAPATAAAPTEGQPGTEVRKEEVAEDKATAPAVRFQNEPLGKLARKNVGSGSGLAKKKVAERAYATPPSDWAEANEKPSPKRITEESGAKGERNGPTLDDTLAPTQSAPAAAAPPRAQAPSAPAGLAGEARSRGTKPSMNVQANSEASGAVESVAQERDEEKSKGGALSRAELLARAKKLEAAQSYDEAAAVWAELVRRFPKDPQVAAWRRSETAARSARN